MDAGQKKAIYEALSAPFPESAVQRTKGAETHKGYDTSGIGYQFVVNRINEVLGIGSFQSRKQTKVREFSRPNGKVAYEAVCDLTLQLGEYSNGHFLPFAEAISEGGHVSSNEADARKGAFTNAFKKAAAFFGAGRQAYEGTLDDDNLPGDEYSPHKPKAKPQPTKPPAKPQAPKVEAPKASVVVDEVPKQAPTGPIIGTPGQVMTIGKRLGIAPDVIRERVKASYGKEVGQLSPTECAQVGAVLIATQAVPDNGAQMTNGAVHA